MIKNKTFLYLFIIFFFASIALNIPFPNKTLYRETVILMNIPIKTLNGLNYVGIISFLLLIVSLYFLVKSLNKYHVRFVLITIIVASFIPSIFINLYQKTFATGIYSISYKDRESRCNFDMINEETLHGECELPLKNNSKNDVQFSIEFYESSPSKYVPKVSLMNKKGPYKVRLKGKESKVVQIEADIDVSKIKKHSDGGAMTGSVPIIIRSGEKSRKL